MRTELLEIKQQMLTCYFEKKSQGSGTLKKKFQLLHKTADRWSIEKEEKEMNRTGREREKRYK